MLLSMPWKRTELVLESERRSKRELHRDGSLLWHRGVQPPLIVSASNRGQVGHPMERFELRCGGSRDERPRRRENAARAAITAASPMAPPDRSSPPRAETEQPAGCLLSLAKKGPQVPSERHTLRKPASSAPTQSSMD